MDSELQSRPRGFRFDALRQRTGVILGGGGKYPGLFNTLVEAEVSSMALKLLEIQRLVRPSVSQRMTFSPDNELTKPDELSLHLVEDSYNRFLSKSKGLREEFADSLDPEWTKNNTRGSMKGSEPRPVPEHTIQISSEAHAEPRTVPTLRGTYSREEFLGKYPEWEDLGFGPLKKLVLWRLPYEVQLAAFRTALRQGRNRLTLHAVVVAIKGWLEDALAPLVQAKERIQGAKEESKRIMGRDVDQVSSLEGLKAVMEAVHQEYLADLKSTSDKHLDKALEKQAQASEERSKALQAMKEAGLLIEAAQVSETSSRQSAMAQRQRGEATELASQAHKLKADAQVKEEQARGLSRKAKEMVEEARKIKLSAEAQMYSASLLPRGFTSSMTPNERWAWLENRDAQAKIHNANNIERKAHEMEVSATQLETAAKEQAEHSAQCEREAARHRSRADGADAGAEELLKQSLTHYEERGLAPEIASLAHRSAVERDGLMTNRARNARCKADATENQYKILWEEARKVREGATALDSELSEVPESVGLRSLTPIDFANVLESFDLQRTVKVLLRLPEEVQDAAIASLQGTPNDEITRTSIISAIRAWVQKHYQKDHSGGRKDHHESSLLKQVEQLMEKDQPAIPSQASSIGGIHEWNFAIRKMQYRLSVGLVHVSLPVLGSWSEDRFIGRTWYWQSCQHNAFLGSGSSRVASTEMPFRAGDHVSVKLDGDCGRVSFFLTRDGHSTHVGDIDNVFGEVHPAVNMQHQGDLVEISPESMPKKEPAPVKERRSSLQSGTKMQTLEDPDTFLPRPYYFAQASAGLQVTRLLDEAEKSLRRINVESTSNVPQPESLVFAKKSLLRAKAVLDGQMSAHQQVMVSNLPPDWDHQSVERLFTSCGRVFSVAVKTDLDFVHPRHRQQATRQMRRPNTIAFVTFESVNGAKAAQLLNGKKVDDHCSIFVKHLFVDSQGSANQDLHGLEQERRVAFSRLAVLEDVLRRKIKELQVNANQAIEESYKSMKISDFSEAGFCLKKASEAIAKLPPGHLLAVEQNQLEEELITLNTNLSDLANKLLADLDNEERKRLEFSCAELKKLEESLLVKGELKSEIAAQVRRKRAELEQETASILAEIRRSLEDEQKQLQRSYLRKLDMDLKARLLRATQLVRESYPVLDYYRLDSLMVRLNWLIDRAEHVLKPVDKSIANMVVGWECITSARHILTLPIAFDDIRRLQIPIKHPVPSKDKDKKEETEEPVQVSLLELEEAYRLAKVILHDIPQSDKLVREVNILSKRLGGLERLCLDHMRPYRSTVVDKCKECAELLDADDLISAARALRVAEDTQRLIPRQLAQKDLHQLRQKIDRLALQQSRTVQVRTSQELRRMQDVKPLYDVFLSYDCGPKSDSSVSTRDILHKSPGSQSLDSYLHSQHTDPKSYALVQRAKQWLMARGWKVGSMDDFDYESINASPGSEIPSSIGMRLTLSGLIVPLQIHSLLPSLLAQVGTDVLQKENAKHKQDKIPISDVDERCKIDKSRFLIKDVVRSMAEEVTYVDIHVMNKETIWDMSESSKVCSALFRAVEAKHPLLRQAFSISACHQPFATSKASHPTASWSGKCEAAIKDSWVVMPFFSTRYLKQVSQKHHLASKAAMEMKYTLKNKSEQSIVPLVLDDVARSRDYDSLSSINPDLQKLQSCSLVACPSDLEFNQSMQKVHEHLLRMGMERDSQKPPMAHKEPPTTKAIDDKHSGPVLALHLLARHANSFAGSQADSVDTRVLARL